MTLYFQGEPYLNRYIFALIQKAQQENIYTVTSTNAHYLDWENAGKTVDSGLDCMIISIDGTDQDTYQSYRKGGKLSKVMEGTRNLLAARKQKGSFKPYVVFQFLVTGPNEHQIDDVKKLAKELGVDTVRFKTAQIYDYQYGSPLIPANPRYSRYKKQQDGTYVIKNRLLNHCWKMWHSCVITWNGKVVPCCFDKDATHQFGDINQEGFKAIWHNKSYRSFRNALMRSRKEIDICKNCTEGTKVWA